MTETPQQPAVQDGREHTEQTRPPGQAGFDSGIDRANLRNYERLYRSVDDRKIAGVAGSAAT
jgi:hypothetical protein